MNFDLIFVNAMKKKKKKNFTYKGNIKTINFKSIGILMCDIN